MKNELKKTVAGAWCLVPGAVKSMALVAALFIGATAEAAFSQGAKVNISQGASITINNYNGTAATWAPGLNSSTTFNGQTSFRNYQVSGTPTTSTKNYALTITNNGATQGAYAFARRGSSGSNGFYYQLAVVDPLRIKVGETKSNVAASGGSYTWDTGKTDSDMCITVTAGTSGSSRNVSIKGEKVGDATCWMTNRTTSAGYYAYKVKVYEEVTTRAQTLAKGTSSLMSAIEAKKAGTWSATSTDSAVATVAVSGSDTKVRPTITAGNKTGQTTITVKNDYCETTFTVTVVDKPVAETQKAKVYKGESVALLPAPTAQWEIKSVPAGVRVDKKSGLAGEAPVVRGLTPGEAYQLTVETEAKNYPWEITVDGKDTPVTIVEKLRVSVTEKSLKLTLPDALVAGWVVRSSNTNVVRQKTALLAANGAGETLTLEIVGVGEAVVTVDDGTMRYQYEITVDRRYCEITKQFLVSVDDDFTAILHRDITNDNVAVWDKVERVYSADESIVTVSNDTANSQLVFYPKKYGTVTVTLETQELDYRLTDVRVYRPVIEKEVALVIGEDGTKSEYSYTFDEFGKVEPGYDASVVDYSQSGKTLTFWGLKGGRTTVDVSCRVDGLQIDTILRYTFVVEKLDGYKVRQYRESYLAYAGEPKVEEQGGSLVFTYTNVAAKTNYFVIPEEQTALVDMYAVGGGGGGGAARPANMGGLAVGAGGGGAGGFSSVTNRHLTAGVFAITVGKGGEAGDFISGLNLARRGDDGGASVVSTTNASAYTYISVRGGGGGGGTGTGERNGMEGGSGGGAASDGTVGLGTNGQGSNGGAATSENDGAWWSGGSGGGAGYAGGDYKTPGAGVTIDFTGSTVYAQGGRGGAGDKNDVAANGVGYGFGGDGANGMTTTGGGGDGANGVVIIRVNSLYKNVLVPYPTTNDLITARFQWEDGATCTAFDPEGKSFISPSNAHPYDWMEAIERIDGVVSTNCTWGGEGGTNKVGVGYHNFTIWLKDGFAWDDGSADGYGSIQGARYRWTIKEDINTKDAEISIKKTVEWTALDRATVTVKTDSSPETYGGGTPRVLFLGTRCQNHRLSGATLTQSIETMATRADVDWYLFGSSRSGNNLDPARLHKSGSLAMNPHAKMPEPLTGGGTPNTTDGDMVGGSHKSLEVFYEYLYKILCDANDTLYKGKAYYDYVVIETDGSRIGHDYVVPSTETARKQQYAVAAALKKYYDDEKVIWVVDNGFDYCHNDFQTGNSRRAFFSSTWDGYTYTGYNTWSEYIFEYGQPAYETYGKSRGISNLHYRVNNSFVRNSDQTGQYLNTLSDDRWHGLLGIFCPKLYLEVMNEDGTPKTGVNDYVKQIVTQDISGGPFTIKAGYEYDQQQFYDNADELAKYLESHIVAKPFSLCFTDKIVSPAEGLTITEVTTKACTNIIDGVASDDPADWKDIISWIPDGHGGGSVEFHKEKAAEVGIKSASMSVDLATNLVQVAISNINFTVSVKYDLSVKDDGRFRTSEGAVYNQRTGQFEKNPNDGMARVDMREENGTAIGVDGEAETDYPLEFVAWPIFGYVEGVDGVEGGVIDIGHRRDNPLSVGEGGDVTVYYRGFGGYKLDSLKVDGNVQTIDEQNETSYSFKAVSNRHEVAVGFRPFIGAATATPAKVMYDGKPHLFDVSVEVLDAAYSNEVRYALLPEDGKELGDEDYLTREQFLATYTDAEYVCASNHTFCYRVYAWQPGYGTNDLGEVDYKLPGLVRVEWAEGQTNVLITPRPLIIRPEYVYYDIPDTELPVKEKIDWKGVTASGYLEEEADVLTNRWANWKTYFILDCPDYEQKQGRYATTVTNKLDVTAMDIAGIGGYLNYAISYEPNVLDIIDKTMVIGGVPQFNVPEPSLTDNKTGVDPVIVTYDGKPHGLTIDVQVPTNDYRITYSTNNWDEVLDENPAFTHVSSNRVWYAVDYTNNTPDAIRYYSALNWQWVIVNPRPITFTAGSTTDVYVASRRLTSDRYDISDMGLADGDTEKVTFSPDSWRINVGATSNDIASVVISNGTIDVTSDYAITTNAGEIVVTPANFWIGGVKYPLDPDAEDTGVDNVLTVYDGNGTNITVTVTQPTDSKVYSVEYATNLVDECWTSTLAFTNVGEYVVYFRVKDHDGNYTQALGIGFVEITNRCVTVKADDKTIRTQQPEPKPYTVSIAVGEMAEKDREDGELQKKLKGLFLDEGNPQCTNFNPDVEAAYPIVYIGDQVKTNGNYAVCFVEGTLTVTNKIPMTITLCSTNVVYGDAAPEFGWTNAVASVWTNGVFAGDAAFDWSKTDVVTNGVEFLTTYSKGDSVKVGGYPITTNGVGLTSVDYAITVVPGTLTVDPAEIKAPTPGGTGDNPGEEPSDEGEPTVWARNIVKCYDGEGTNVLAKVYGKTHGNAFEYSYSTNGVDFVGWEDLQFTNVVDGLQVWYLAKNEAGNYLNATNWAYVTITQRVIAAKGGIVANDATMTYKKPDTRTKELTWKELPADALAKGDYLASVDLVYTNEAVLAELPVNDKGYAGFVSTNRENAAAIVITNRQGAVVTGNYVLEFTAGALKVTKSRDWDVDYDDDKSRKYKGEPWTFDLTVTNNVGGATIPADEYQVDWYANTNATKEAYFVVTMTNNYDGVSTNYFTIYPREIWFVTEGTNFTYSGEAQTNAVVKVADDCDGFVLSDGVTTNGFKAVTNVKDTPTDNEFYYTLNLCPVSLDSDYEIKDSLWGTLTMKAAEIKTPTPKGTGDNPDEEPSDEGEPTVWARNIVKCYDGEGTNVLAKVYGKTHGNAFEYSYSTNGVDFVAWEDLQFTNVVDGLQVWYLAKNEAGNYLNATNWAYVTITNRPAKITSGTKLDFVYDGQPHAYTNLTVEGFVEGEGLATTSDWATVTNVGTNDNSFAYTLKDNTLASNYALTVVTGKIAVVQGSFTFKLDSYDGAYDGHTYKVDVSPDSTLPKGSTVWYSTDGGETWTEGEAPTFTDVTNVTVTVKVMNPNFEDRIGSKELKITPRAITLTSPDKDWDYDGEEHTFEAKDITIGGSYYADGECFDYIDLAKITEKGTKPATFTAVDSKSAKTSNYKITYEYGKLTINAAKDELGVKSLSGEWPYDGQPHGAGWEPMNSGNLIAGDAFDAKLDGVTVTTPDDGIVSNTFEYARILRDGKTDVTANYTGFVVITGTLKIVNAEFKDVTAAPIVKTYDGVATNIEVKVNEPLATDAAVVYSKVGPDGPWSENPTFKDVETATVWYKVTARYFNDYIGSTTVEVKKRKLVFKSKDGETVFDSTKTVQINTDLKTIEETDASEGIVEGEEDGITFENPREVTEVTEGVDATYDVVFNGETAKEENYDVTKNYGTLRVYAQGILTIRAEDHEFDYTGGTFTWPKYVPTGLKPGDGIKSVTFDPASKISKPSEGEVANKITDVVITNGATDVKGKYTIKYVDGKLTMKRASLKDVTAEGIEKIYDAVKTNITVVVKDKLIDPSAKVTILYRTSEGEPWNGVNPSFVNKVETDVMFKVSVPEYEDFEGKAHVKIDLRPITLLSASATKTYDGKELVSNEVVIVAGTLAEGDSADTKDYLTFKCSGSQTLVGHSDNVYTYGVTNRLGTADLYKNYDFVILNGTLTVDPAKLVYDPETYTGPYDNHDHMVQIPEEQKDKLPEGAKVSYSTDGVNWTEYPAELKGHDVTNVTVYVRVEAPNYATETVPVVLNIYKRELTLEGPNKNKPYDGEPLTFTGEEIAAGGQKYADGECFLYSDFASITEIGETNSTFRIADNPDNGTKQSNYDITIITDRYLTVLPNENQILVRSLSAKKPYDGEPLTAGWEVLNAHNLAEGDGLDVELAGASVTEPGSVPNAFDHVEITNGTGRVTKTYTNLVIKVGTLEVTPANFQKGEVTAEPIRKLYDGIETNIDVQVTNPLAQNVQVTYSLDGETFGTIDPFLHACDRTTVWYKVTADHFNDYVGSTTVEILKRKLVYRSANSGKFFDSKPLETDTSKIELIEEESDGLVPGEKVSFTPTASATTVADSGTPATFDVVFEQGLEGDYAVEKRYGKLYIYQPGVLTIIAGSEEFVFDGKTHTCTDYVAEGLKDGDKIVEIKFEGSISHPSQSPVANQVIRESVVIVTAGDEPVDPEKYAGFATFDGELTMKPAKLADYVTSEGAEKTYDGEATNITVTVDLDQIVEASRGTVNILYSIAPQGPFTDKMPTFTEASTYTVYFKVEADGYEPTPIMSEQVEILTRKVTFASAGAEKTYDGEPLETNEVKVVVGSIVAGQKLVYGCTGSRTDVGASDNTFTNSIIDTVTGKDCKNNYSVAYEYGQLVVTPATQKYDDPTPPETPEGYVGTPYDYYGCYDGKGHTITPFTVTDPDHVTFYFSSNATDWVKSETGAVPAQFYATNVCEKTRVYFKSVAPNYADVVTNGFITITQRVVTVSFTANDKVYDRTDVATLKGTNVVNVVEGESFQFSQEGMSYAFDTAEVGNGKTVTADGYTDEQMIPGAGTLKGNYTFDFIPTTMANITKAKMPDPEDPEDPENPKHPAAGPMDGPNVGPEPHVPPLPGDDGFVRLSDYDVITNYDGKAHTFDTNALFQALAHIAETNGYFGLNYKVEYSLTGADQTWTNEPFAWVNVCDTPTSFWYRVTATDNLTSKIHAVGVTILPKMMWFGPDEDGEDHPQDPANPPPPNDPYDDSGTSNGVRNVVAEYYEGISTNIIVNVVRPDMTDPSAGVEILYSTNKTVWVEWDELQFEDPVLTQKVWYVVSAPNYQTITNYGYVTIYKAEVEPKLPDFFDDLLNQADIDLLWSALRYAETNDVNYGAQAYIKYLLTLAETNKLSKLSSPDRTTRNWEKKSSDECVNLLAWVEREKGVTVTYANFFDVILERTFKLATAKSEYKWSLWDDIGEPTTRSENPESATLVCVPVPIAKSELENKTLIGVFTQHQIGESSYEEPRELDRVTLGQDGLNTLEDIIRRNGKECYVVDDSNQDVYKVYVFMRKFCPLLIPFKEATQDALFGATLGWKYYSGTGSYFANLTVWNSNTLDRIRYDKGTLRFCFADRTNTAGRAMLALGDSWTGGYVKTNETIKGVTYRVFPLEDFKPDAEYGGWTEEGASKSYGPGESRPNDDNINGTPEMFVYKRIAPEWGNEEAAWATNFVAWLVWDWTNPSTEPKVKTTYAIPLLATKDGAAKVATPKQAVFVGGPISVSEYNEVLAFGVRENLVTGRILNLKVEDGRGEIGVGFENTETGALIDPGPNVRVIVQGAEDLGGPFEDMGELKTEDGTAEFGLQGKQFFKVKAEALPVVK